MRVPYPSDITREQFELIRYSLETASITVVKILIDNSKLSLWVMVYEYRYPNSRRKM